MGMFRAFWQELIQRNGVLRSQGVGPARLRAGRAEGRGSGGLSPHLCHLQPVVPHAVLAPPQVLRAVGVDIVHRDKPARRLVFRTVDQIKLFT